MTTTCTTCGKAYEAGSDEQANETVRECQQCRIVAKLVVAQDAMKAAAGAMIREGGLYKDHGREMMGATRIIDGWFREMSDDHQHHGRRVAVPCMCWLASRSPAQKGQI